MIDKAFQNSLANHPLQTWEWGEARRKMGIRVETFVEKDSIFQMTIHPIPHLPFSIGYIPRSLFPSKSMQEKVYEFGKKNGLIFIKFEPYSEYISNFKPPTTQFKIVESQHPLFPEWTQILDISLSEDELLKKMKPKTRYNIRLAEKKGVQVKQMDTDEGFSIFSKLYFETCKRQRYHGHTPEYHKAIWDSMRESCGHILISFYNGVPLGAYELYYFKERLYYVYGGSSTEYKQMMAPNLLMWEAIKFGKKCGGKTFDMWGSLPPEYPQNHAWAGFTRFKEGYGTQFAHLSQSFDIVVNPILYKLYSFAYSLREKIL